MQQNYGPEGSVLMSAALADFALTALFAGTGIILGFACGFSGPLAVVSYVMFLPLVCVGSVAAARNLRANKTGRLFREGRPFQR
jgi:hypothetical protein